MTASTKPEWMQKVEDSYRDQLRNFVETWRRAEDAGRRNSSFLVDAILKVRSRLPDNDTTLTESNPPRSLLVAMDRRRPETDPRRHVAARGTFRNEE